MINSLAFGLPRLMTMLVPVSASGSSFIRFNALITSSRESKRLAWLLNRSNMVDLLMRAAHASYFTKPPRAAHEDTEAMILQMEWKHGESRAGPLALEISLNRSKSLLDSPS